MFFVNNVPSSGTIYINECPSYSGSQTGLSGIDPSSSHPSSFKASTLAVGPAKVKLSFCQITFKTLTLLIVGGYLDQ